MLNEAEWDEVKKLASAYELDHVKAAMEQAYRAHDETGQTYESGPYSDHLRQVDRLLCEWLDTQVDLTHKLRTCVRVGGIFHDYFEDCVKSEEMKHALTEQHIRNHPIHGIDIALLCTDPPGSNRLERKAKAYPRIAGCYGALLVKLADRTCHLRVCVAQSNLRYLKLYVNEHELFSRHLLHVTHARFEPLRRLYELASQDYLKAMEVACRRLGELEAASSGGKPMAPEA